MRVNCVSMTSAGSRPHTAALAQDRSEESPNRAQAASHGPDFMGPRGRSRPKRRSIPHRTLSRLTRALSIHQAMRLRSQFARTALSALKAQPREQASVPLQRSKVAPARCAKRLEPGAIRSAASSGPFPLAKPGSSPLFSPASHRISDSTMPSIWKRSSGGPLLRICHPINLAYQPHQPAGADTPDLSSFTESRRRCDEPRFNPHPVRTSLA